LQITIIIKPGAATNRTATPAHIKAFAAAAVDLQKKPLIARRLELSPEEFIRHWVEVHAPLVGALPGLRRYVQDHVVDERRAPGVPSIGAGIDGIAELWFDDLASLDRVKRPGY
jgi:uncharacterized protein (TIGR02118 family)